MARFSFRPRSLTGLILLGFVIVALPALLGTISAAIEMRTLSAASERLVVNGVAATQYTQALVRQVSSLERTVRLYQIIPRPALLETFVQNRDLLGLHALGDGAAFEHRADRIGQCCDGAQIGDHAV